MIAIHPTRRMLALLAVLLPFLAADAASAANLRALSPGEFVVREQEVPVRVVFIGYAPDQVDEDALVALLPQTYSPVVRFPRFYGLNGRDTGLRHRFRYSVDHAPSAFADSFFAFLTAKGEAGPLTAFQDLYNQEQKNVLDVTGPVLYIDAPTVERYLSHFVRDQRGYTIFFINWFGRSDFKFHVYTKTDEPDPDTDYNFGVLRASRKMIAWGGTSSRTWFYDASAGPESWTNNWSVDDDESEYHIPPIWEYQPGAYREPAELTGDLGLVARFVGINLLFTTSPLYDPLVTAPDVGGAKVAHVAMLQDDPASNGLDFIDIPFTKTELRRFQPYYRWKVGLTNTDPIDANAKRSLDIFALNSLEPDCWVDFGTPFAQMFCYFSANLDTYVPAYGPNDYVGEIFAFNTTAANLGAQFGLLGFADDNWIDGTQSHVFMFDAAEYRDLGFGFTTTGIHEFGHHIGVSHPHDGYDSELDVDYGPSGPFEFAWSGDESHTVMHYLSTANGFGRFDRDNMYRWETAGYLNWANAVLGDIVTHPDAFLTVPLILAADAVASQSLKAFDRWDYLPAATGARLSYDFVAVAAKLIGADTPTLAAALRLLPNASFPREGCRIREPEN